MLSDISKGRSLNGRPGFTLTELLVVIAIIALLSSLLIPGLARAKQSAYSASCRNNLRQWGMSLQMYVGDFQVYPPYQMSDSGRSEDNRSWQQRLATFTGSKRLEYADAVLSGGARFKGLDICPAYDRLRGFYGPASGSSYAYNSQGYCKGNHPEENFGLGGIIVPAPPSGNCWEPEDIRCIRESEVAHPSQMIALGDSMLFWVSMGTPVFSYLGYDAYGAGGGFGMEPIRAQLKLGPGIGSDKTTIDNSLRGIQDRHGGRWNTVFCDAHVESMKTAEMFDPRKDQILRRWHKDGLPHREWLGFNSPH